MKNNLSEFDCSQFIDDHDILRQFPFPLTIYQADDDESKYGISAALMDENNTFVDTLAIYNEKIVPWSLFCLTNLQTLKIERTPFQNGNSFLSV
jgi:hypothetical protein